MILVPLMLMGPATWSLDPAVTPNMPDDIRVKLLLTVRIWFPGLFAVGIAFLIPTISRFLQIASVGGAYLLFAYFCPTYIPSVIYNPMICMVAATSALFAFLPASTEYDYSRDHTNRLFFGVIFAFILPILTMIGLLLVVKQINTYVQFTFEDIFGKDLTSAVYVPLYILLQTLGMQDLIDRMISIVYQNNLVNAFVNAIIVTNIISLPMAMLVRSLFVKNHMRLFITLLALITWLTSSNGTCVALSWLALLLIFPGVFALLLMSSVLCFFISYINQVGALTTINNLYSPDINLANIYFLFSSHTTMLEMFAFLLPSTLVACLMICKSEYSKYLKLKAREVNFGYNINKMSSPELKVVAILRSFGGISNIADIEADSNWLYVQVIDRNRVSTSTLNVLTHSKVLMDRVNKLYLCDIGARSQFYCKRIMDLMENHFGEEEYEVPVGTPVPLDSLIAGLDKQDSSSNKSVDKSSDKSTENPVYKHHHKRPLRTLRENQ